jgi:alpha-glucosidase (family GH31 glycosyl hydrolase)
MQPGAAGNIQAGDIHLVLSSDLLVKNLAAFSGGQDERHFQTVAQADLDTLTIRLQNTLSQHIPQAFSLSTTDTLYVTHCHFSSQPDHQVGEEAQTVTIRAVDTCSAVAYDTQELQQKIEAIFTSTQPGKHYQLLGQVSSKVLTVTPFTVQVSGTWVYLLSEDYEQFLAQKIAGEMPQQARKYLLNAGLIVDAHIPAQLPRDPQHIHFEIIIGAGA